MNGNNLTTLFEYNRYEFDEKLYGDKTELKKTLQTVWNSLIAKPNAIDYFNSSEQEDAIIEIENEGIDVDKNKVKAEKEQRFFNFYDIKIKPNNYIGFIQNGDKLIEIYPKIFRNEEETKENKKKWLSNIFYWLSYCDWLPARIDNTEQSHNEIDKFPDFLIYHIASLIEKTVSEQPYSKYQEVEEILYSPKGRINFPAYINHGLSHGNWHQVDCVYEPFVYNNSVNQIIKHVARLLNNYTNFSENNKKLDNILFILDEVDDRVCSSAEIEQLKFSDLFSDYKDVLYWCKLILDQQIFDNNANDSNTFCFLLPMEKIFEGFIAGVLKEKFGDKIETQKQKNLAKIDKNDVFQVKPDIVYYNDCKNKEVDDKKVDKNKKVIKKIRKKEIELILDTKYKIRDEIAKDKQDNKAGVSQSDMYQMLAYAIKFDCQKVKLVYPSTNNEIKEAVFTISTKVEEKNEIEIKAISINIANENREELKTEIRNLIN